MLDSNLVIYAAKPEYPGLRRWTRAVRRQSRR